VTSYSTRTSSFIVSRHALDREMNDRRRCVHDEIIDYDERPPSSSAITLPISRDEMDRLTMEWLVESLKTDYQSAEYIEERRAIEEEDDMKMHIQQGRRYQRAGGAMNVAKALEHAGAAYALAVEKKRVCYVVSSLKLMARAAMEQGRVVVGWRLGEMFIDVVSKSLAGKRGEFRRENDVIAAARDHYDAAMLYRGIFFDGRDERTPFVSYDDLIEVKIKCAHSRAGEILKRAKELLDEVLYRESEAKAQFEDPESTELYLDVCVHLADIMGNFKIPEDIYFSLKDVSETSALCAQLAVGYRTVANVVAGGCAVSNDTCHYCFERVGGFAVEDRKLTLISRWCRRRHHMHTACYHEELAALTDDIGGDLDRFHRLQFCFACVEFDRARETTSFDPLIARDALESHNTWFSYRDE